MLNDKGFDLWADGYDKAVALTEEANIYPFAGYKEVLDGIFQEVMSKEHPAILDIGFGTGTLTAKLYDNGCEVFGQDFSRRMIELAKEKMPEAQLFQGDFTDGLVTELRERRYDYIIASYSIHHLSDEIKAAFLTELLALLNDGGKILIGDVAFETRSELEKCKDEAGDNWDEDEIYFVADELRKTFPKLVFERKSYCSGIIIIQ